MIESSHSVKKCSRILATVCKTFELMGKGHLYFKKNPKTLEESMIF